MKLDLQWNHKEDEQFTLFDAQKGDLKLVCTNTHFANFSEMGAGKTLPNALLSKGVIEDNICDYAIIVTPKVVLSDWHDVFKEQIVCDPSKLITMYHAPTKVRPHIKFRPIIIMTYETLSADIHRIYDLALNNRVMITFDEAHKLRNHDSARTNKCTELAKICKRVYLLTGTPITNGLKNAFSYINMLRSGMYYNSFEHFKRKHMRYSKYNRRQLIGYIGTEEVSKILDSFSVRHLKREIHELPDVTFKTRLLDWDPVQKRLYKHFVADLILELKDSFLQTTKGGALLVRCHQIITNPQQLDLPCDSTRFKMIEEDFEMIGPEDNKIVVFAHYRHTIKRLIKQFKHLNPAVIYGGTTDIEKQKDMFKNDDTCRLMLAHPLSAGLGTNFSISSNIIFFEYSYDLDSYDQAVSRLDRPGQKNAITVLNYAVRGSIEQTKLLPNLVEKKAFSTSLLNDPVELIKFLSLVDEEIDEPDYNF
jgi:SNF2 family DNA or RNA helicase